MREGPVQKLCNRDTAVVSAKILYIIKRGEEEGQVEGERAGEVFFNFVMAQF